ncbi:mCG144755, partial [Mus musculus]
LAYITWDYLSSSVTTYKALSLHTSITIFLNPHSLVYRSQSYESIVLISIHFCLTCLGLCQVDKKWGKKTLSNFAFFLYKSLYICHGEDLVRS